MCGGDETVFEEFLSQDHVVFQQGRGDGTENVGEVSELPVVSTGVFFDLVDVFVELDECFSEIQTLTGVMVMMTWSREAKRFLGSDVDNLTVVVPRDACEGVAALRSSLSVSPI